MKIENNLLIKDSSESFKLDIDRALNYANHQPQKDSGKLKNPDVIVIHYTASDNIKGDIHTLYESSKKASVHFVVAIDGTVHQLMPLDKIAWHAGSSRLGNRTSLNKYSIGIEIVNPGFLTEKSNGSFSTWYQKEIPAEKAIKLKHKNEREARYWHTYTEEQISSVLELCDSICDSFHVQHIVGHDDISPGRKQDPGPAFPLDQIQNQLLSGRNENEIPESTNKTFSTVKVEHLNIRQNGNVNSQKIAMPLEKGQSVKILDEKNGWYKVETNIIGWVSSDYIE